MSGVSSIASHWGLQYLPSVTLHEHTGCAHFSRSFDGMIPSNSSGSICLTLDGPRSARMLPAELKLSAL